MNELKRYFRLKDLTFATLEPRLILPQSQAREQLKLQYKEWAILSLTAEQ